MIEKGLTNDVADAIGKYVQLSGGKELVQQLQEDTKLMSVKDAETGLNEMQLLFQYCEAMGITEQVKQINDCIHFYTHYNIVVV